MCDCALWELLQIPPSTHPTKKKPPPRLPKHNENNLDYPSAHFHVIFSDHSNRQPLDGAVVPGNKPHPLNTVQQSSMKQMGTSNEMRDILKKD